MLGTPKPLGTTQRVRASPGISLRATEGRSLGGQDTRKYGGLAGSDEHSASVAVSGSESGHTVQVCGGTEHSGIQAGQPLAIQEIEAGPVDGREVEPDGAGSETESEGRRKCGRLTLLKAQGQRGVGATKTRGRGHPRHTKRRAHVWNGIED